MFELKILLYSSQRSQRIVYQDNDGVMISEIEQVFLRKCEVDFCATTWARVVVSDNTRCALKGLEQKYDTVTGRHIRKLYGFISKLSDGEVFYYLNEDKVSVVERRAAYDSIKKQHLGVGVVHNAAFSHYSMLDYFFQYLSYGYDGIEEWIGEKDVSRRVCRFCGQKYPEVTFKKVAHAVQDALGNKLLFCYEECDTCNHDLASIEDNFRKIMDFRRAIYHIPRKGTTSSPKVVGKTFIIEPNNQGYPELFLMEEYISPKIDRAKPFIMHLELKDTMTNEGMYKALCKMVIDMLPSSELHHFENTVKWMTSNGRWAPDSLPSTWLSVLPTGNIVYPQPVLDILLNNKGRMPDSPYCTGILWIYDIAYMFVMPLTDVDAGKYKYDYDLTIHWHQVSKMIGLHNRQRQDSNNYHPSTPWVDWDVDLSLSNIHVLPKSDPIFLECLATKVNSLDIGMPPFTKNGIVFYEAKEIEYECYYNDTITDKDLRDLTLHIAGPRFLIDPINSHVHVKMESHVNDTTDKVRYYRYSFSVIFYVPTFWSYINIEMKENALVSFAFHYGLRDYLYESALRHIEPAMSRLRAGSPFAKCSLEKMIEYKRILTLADYLVPIGNDNNYIEVLDSEIHSIECE